MRDCPEAICDAEVIHRSLTEPQAFRVIFERHFEAVHRFAQRRAGPDLADEVAAETFARAFDLRRRYDLDRPDAKPWLFGIASNVAGRHWRDERRRATAHERSEVDVDFGKVEGAALSADMVDALDRLRADDREALLLLAWGDLAYDEIATVLGIPIGTVRSRVARARRRMREQLGAEKRTTSPSRLEEACDVRP